MCEEYEECTQRTLRVASPGAAALNDTRWKFHHAVVQTEMLESAELVTLLADTRDPTQIGYQSLLVNTSVSHWETHLGDLLQMARDRADGYLQSGVHATVVFLQKVSLHLLAIEQLLTSSCEQWMSDWSLASALDEASDGVVAELDTLANFMFPEQAPAVWLLGEAIDDLVEGVMVASSMFLHAVALAQLASTRCSNAYESDPWNLTDSVRTVHAFVNRFSDRMDTFDSDTAYQLVWECLRSRVVLVVESLSESAELSVQAPRLMSIDTCTSLRQSLEHQVAQIIPYTEDIPDTYTSYTNSMGETRTVHANLDRNFAYITPYASVVGRSAPVADGAFPDNDKVIHLSSIERSSVRRQAAMSSTGCTTTAEDEVGGALH